MSEEEIMGTLRLMQERIALLVDILTRMEQRQIEVKKEIETKPAEGSFGARDQ